MIPVLLLAAAAQQMHLSRLQPICGPIAASHQACGSDIFKPVWRRFESDTGELTFLDTNFIEPTGGEGGTIRIYVTPPGAVFDERRLAVIYITCRGQYSPIGDLASLSDAPPRSIMGLIATASCPTIARKRAAFVAKRNTADPLLACTGPLVIYDPADPDAPPTCHPKRRARNSN